MYIFFFFFFQAEDGIRDIGVTGVQTCALPILGSVFVGGIVMALIFSSLDMTSIAWYEHLVLGGFCFGAVFMATDPVTSARTEMGKYIYGFMIGAMAIIVRVMNPGYPEGMMLAIFFGNMFAPLIDYCVVSRNIARRTNRINK